MKKVNIQVIAPWIAKKVTELVGFEDEVVIEYAMGLLEDKDNPVRIIDSATVLFELTDTHASRMRKRCRLI